MNCPKCGSNEQEEKVKPAFGPVCEFRWMVCKGCGLNVSTFPKYKPRTFYHLIHHCWCNDFMQRDMENCRFCNPPDEDGMWEHHPYDPFGGTEMEDDLMTKHFPENVKRC